MTEAEVRRLLLVQAIETAAAQPAGAAPWSAAESAAAASAAAHALGQDAPFERFALARAQEVLRRLAAKVPGVTMVPRASAIRWGSATAAAALAAFALGAAADAGWSGGRIQLLALPVLGLLAWNLAVYLLLAAWAVQAVLRRRPGHRWGVRRAGPSQAAAAPGEAAAQRSGSAVSAWLAAVDAWVGRSLRRDRSAPAWWHAAQDQQARWMRPVLAAVQGHRAAALLHTAAAMLALGVVASLYARGLVFDFRAGWDSTFLDAAQVHAVLSLVLAPATAVPGLALPGVDELARLRWADGGAGAPAGLWIHRMAWTLGCVAVLPRLVLAAASAWRAQRAATQLAWAADPPYLAQLRQQAPSTPVRVQVLPYNCRDSAARLPGLVAALRASHGPGAQPQCLPVLPLGAEDALPAGLPPPHADAVRHWVLLMSLNATPEREHHLAMMAALPRHLPPGVELRVLLDSHDFDRRIHAAPDAAQRRAQRVAAWQTQVAEAGLTPPSVADLGATSAGPASDPPHNSPGPR